MATITTSSTAQLYFPVSALNYFIQLRPVSLDRALQNENKGLKGALPPSHEQFNKKGTGS
jgi:hypothetical protein